MSFWPRPAPLHSPPSRQHQQSPSLLQHWETRSRSDWQQAIPAIQVATLRASCPMCRGCLQSSLSLPAARKIGIVNDTSDIKATPQWDEINAVASKFEVTIVGADARKPENIDPTFRKFKAEGVDVVIVLQASSLILDRTQIAIAAAATRLPTVFGYREHAETGGLISYGVNLEYCFRRAASYVHRILKGTSVADLPIEFPTKLELIINVRTAKTLGVEIPPTLLARADEVIE